MNWRSQCLVALLFTVCVAPTFISYKPYVFEWDDSDYLRRSIKVSHGFWSGNVHELGAMASIRPPAMTLLGIPWGPLTTWHDAGKCFVTLGAMISLVAALCFYFLLRLGVTPLWLALGSLCTIASLGPCPPGAIAHIHACGFMADSLFAWTTLAAALLIPYEARVPCHSHRGAILSGMLWAAVLSLGAMTKLNFLFVILLVGPSVILIRARQGGFRSALAAGVAFVFCSIPAAIYYLAWGRPAFVNAKASSFGEIAGLYYIPLGQFLVSTIQQSPGLALSCVLTTIALAYVVLTRRRAVLGVDLLAFAIVLVFGIVILSAPNRQIRYAFPAVIALPFLAAVLVAGKRSVGSWRSAATAAVVVFCGLFVAGIPMRNRAAKETLTRSDAVLAYAAGCNAKHIVLGTDSPTLNHALMDVAILVSPLRPTVEVETLAYRAIDGVPIEDDFRTMDGADEIILQADNHVAPPFTNRRLSEYVAYLRQRAYTPVTVAEDVYIYTHGCGSQSVRH